MGNCRDPCLSARAHVCAMRGGAHPLFRCANYPNRGNGKGGGGGPNRPQGRGRGNGKGGQGKGHRGGGGGPQQGGQDQ